MLSFSAWLKGGPLLDCLGNRLRVILYFTSQAGTWLLPGVDWGQERLGQGTVDSENWWKKNTRWNNLRHLRDNLSHRYVSCLLLLHPSCACRRASMVLVQPKVWMYLPFSGKMGSSPKLNCNDFRRCYMVWKLRLRPQMLGIIWGDVVSLF